MKLDNKYFDCKLIDLLNCFSFRKHLNPEPNDGYKPELDILQQIARDAAEEQRHKCYSYCESNKSHTCFQCNKKLEIPDA